MRQNEMRQIEMREFLLTETARRASTNCETPDLGPSYSAKDWLGQITLAERKSCERAIAGLESEGLIIVTRNAKRRISNLKLSPSGEMAVGELLKENATVGDANGITRPGLPAESFVKDEFFMTMNATMSETVKVPEVLADPLTAPEAQEVETVEAPETETIETEAIDETPSDLPEAPISHFLRLNKPTTGRLSPALNKRFNDFDRKARQALTDEARLRADRDELLRTGYDELTPRQMEAAGVPLRERLAEIEKRQNDLYVEKYQLAVDSCDEARVLHLEAQQRTEDSITEIKKAMGAGGIDADSFAAEGGGGSDYRFTLFVQRDERYLSHRRVEENARAEYQTLVGWAQTAKNNEILGFNLILNEPSDPEQALVARVANLIQTKKRVYIEA